MGTQRAIEIIKDYNIDVTLPTLISWIKEYELGRKIGGRWRVFEEDLHAHLRGE